MASMASTICTLLITRPFTIIKGPPRPIVVCRLQRQHEFGQFFYARQHRPICYSAYMPCQFRLSVRPSVRLSHACIVSKRLNVSSKFFHHQIGPSFYTVSQRNWGTRIMSHSSRKCGPILIILSLLHTQMNCRKRLIKIYHLTSNLLPHYRVKLECSTLLLYSTLSNANVT